MHLAIYAGTEAQAIVHVHPPMVLAFSLAHQTFTPISFEEKYTIGAVPVVAQDTPTVTRPEQVVEELKYRPVVILQGHGPDVIGCALVNKDVVIRLRIIASHSTVRSVERRQRRERICKTTTPCRNSKAGSGVVIDKPDHAADRD